MGDVQDDGPFFHGTTAVLQAGDLLTAGFRSNYRPEVVMRHVYFTALPDGAGMAAELAVELRARASAESEAVAPHDPAEPVAGVAPHVYRVEPTGPFEDDPNVTDKKFPGNPTRSYRSTEPVRVVAEVTDWTRLTPEALQWWRERIVDRPADERGEILN
ncbi:NAD(+)--rifampin ADP-ribosyltransferase [Microbacterium sp. M1A1_1b]|uniref:NAD(+)--rifampin ADP-ribosyltransferase n=1 Tax=Curtobacterium sp. VKM Ac-2922 TaxID=2929475 RepID=UPI001FB42A88|nr:NAD(+)--rifampin ADP-ribosyltransferase [Curtobacterium sp. VKM Ac-2922]MCJ1715601.1 NAD(+)--rifampin ADP-ribosyltransferase [Curtobacterium sp. VKM Ac-2922]